MKFSKVLQSQEQRFPEKRFLDYKKLKKLLKSNVSALEKRNADRPDVASEAHPDCRVYVRGADGASARRRSFLKLLNQELHRLNADFISAEETMVIRLQALESALKSPGDKLEYSHYIIHFRAEIVALMHWVVLNYAAIAKILKKHDKLMAGELLERLSHTCDKLLGECDISDEAAEETPFSEELSGDMEEEDQSYLNRMRSAMQTWIDLGDNAHTPSTVLPYYKPVPESMKIVRDRPKKRQKPEDDEEVKKPSKTPRPRL